MELRTSTEITAPASDAWRLLADGFGDIGRWTTAVDRSRLVGDRVEAGAVRECRISGPGTGGGLTVERVTLYDPEAMVFAYEAVRGLPRFLSAGGTQFAVSAVSDRSCRVEATATVTPAPWARPFRPLLGLLLRRMIRGFVADARRELAHGIPPIGGASAPTGAAHVEP